MISSISNRLAPVLQRIPRPAAWTAASLASGWIAAEVTSDYRIGGVVILGVGVASILPKKIQGYVKRYFYSPPQQDPSSNTSYLGLFGTNHFMVFSRYLDRPLRKQIIEDSTPDAWWQMALANDLKNPSQDKEKEARSALASLGILVDPKMGVSASEFLFRHQALLSANSPVFQNKKALSLKNTQLILMGTPISIKGPFLQVASPQQAFNWLTGNVLLEISSYPSCVAVNRFPFLQSSTFLYSNVGKTLERTHHRLFCTASNCVEKKDSRTLVILETSETIKLERDCNEVIFIHDSFLGYEDSDGKLWIKKGGSEYPCQMDLRTVLSLKSKLYLQGPYLVDPKGVYSLETGNKVLDFPIDIGMKHVRIFQNSLSEWLINYFVKEPGTERNKKVTYCINRPLDPPVQELLPSGDLLQEGPLVCIVRNNEIILEYAGQTSAVHTIITNLNFLDKICVHAIYNSCLLVEQKEEFYKVDLLDQ